MSIFEYDEEKVLKLIRREEYEEGKIDGIAEGKIAGLTEGEILKTAELAVSLLRKDYSPENISDILEVDISYVQEITKIVEKYPDESNADIAKRMINSKTSLHHII